MKKISVIGAGLVGATSVYSMMLKEIADEIALIDIDDKRSNAEVWDIRHGFPEVSKTVVKKGTYADCKDSDVIVITAGVARKVGESRNDLLIKNSTFWKLQKFGGMISQYINRIRNNHNNSFSICCFYFGANPFHNLRIF